MAGDNLAQYYKTRNNTNQGVPLWAPDSMLWPTFLAFFVALVTFIFSGIVLIAYFWGEKVAEMWDNRRAT